MSPLLIAGLLGACGVTVEQGPTTVTHTETKQETVTRHVESQPTTSESTAPSEEPSGPCQAETSVGTTVEVKVVAGEVDCDEAQAVLSEYYSRAPTAGTGSGGRLTVDCSQAGRIDGRQS